MSNLTGNINPQITLEDAAETFVQFFLCSMGLLALLVHVGLMFLEGGSVRSKNVTNAISRSLIGLFIGTIMYWATGFAFAYGKPGNMFIGHSFFFSINADQAVNITNGAFLYTTSSYHAHWFFELVFAIVATSIASGAISERVEFGAYMIYCFFMTGFIYPVVSHWCWSSCGWLRTGAGTELTFQDFAGSGVVHLCGGTAALIGSVIIGPRLGKFHADDTVEEYPGHSVSLTTIGSYLMYVGLLALNGGSVVSLHSYDGVFVFAKSVTNIIIGGSAGALLVMVVCKVTDYWKGNESFWSLHWCLKGGLAGMVAVSATSNDLQIWSSVVIGTIAASVLIDWHYFLLYLKIDDPVDAVGVHFGGGLCGILLGPIFAVNGLKRNGKYVGGIVYGGGAWAWKNWSWNIAGLIAIILWTGVCVGVLFGILRRLKILRVKKEVELNGLDRMIHNEPAYPDENRIDEGTPLLTRNDSEL